MARQLTDAAIKKIAADHKLPAAVLKAMLQTESGPNLDLEQRFEKGHFERILNPRKGDWLAPFHATVKNEKGDPIIDVPECRARATSWGVGHVMGWRLRHMGYKGKLADLNEKDEEAAAWAAKCLVADMKTAEKIAAKFPLSRDKYERGIAVYNTGGGSWPVRHIETYRGHLARATMTMA